MLLPCLGDLHGIRAKLGNVGSRGHRPRFGCDVRGAGLEALAHVCRDDGEMMQRAPTPGTMGRQRREPSQHVIDGLAGCGRVPKLVAPPEALQGATACPRHDFPAIGEGHRAAIDDPPPAAVQVLATNVEAPIAEAFALDQREQHRRA